MEKIYINGEYKTIGGVKQIVGNAPKHLDTLEEIAEVIESGDKEVILDCN